MNQRLHRSHLIIPVLLIGLGWMLWPSPLTSQPAQPGKRVVPKLVPLAETKLLMAGLAHANFRGLDRILKQKPTEDQAWTFARGQALLIAETANLLMLRPPRNQGESTWFERSTELRSTASRLAQTLGKHDFQASRAGLVDVANTCNRCHQAFRVKVLITPFDEAQPAP